MQHGTQVREPICINEPATPVRPPKRSKHYDAQEIVNTSQLVGSYRPQVDGRRPEATHSHDDVGAILAASKKSPPRACGIAHNRRLKAQGHVLWQATCVRGDVAATQS